ncbi:hypothetical protein T439DRAFT_352470 [Meredithblackwellia eburnea MCA 4105]
MVSPAVNPKRERPQSFSATENETRSVAGNGSVAAIVVLAEEVGMSANQPDGQNQLLGVTRYSALVFGVLYGVLHRRTLQAKYDADVEAADLRKREHWVEQAKKAWAQKNSKSDGVISDPDAPGFDLEAYLKSLE